MTLVQSIFKIRRYWLKRNTPQTVLDTLNIRAGTYYEPDGSGAAGMMPYVDVHYWGDGDKNLTMMELRYGDWVMDRQELTYTLEGDDGLEDPDADTD